MHPSGFVAGAFLLLLVYWEAFETIVFPRRVSRRFRFTSAFYRATWMPWRAIGSRLGRMYEPYMNALGDFLLMRLPTWVSPQGARDNWQSLA